MSHVLVVGLSHHSAPVEVREQIALAPDAYGDVLLRLAAEREVRECIVLSTCNRSELYAVTESYHGGRETLERALYALGENRGGVRDEHLFRLEGAAAVRHLFRVASSLDALVVGEPQVLGQVKEAYRIAGEHDSAGPVLDRLFRQALEVGKRVRTETEIGAWAVSVSYAAVELAKKIFGPLEGRSALIIGAGETGELTLKHLKSAGVGELLVANRTEETARQMAEAMGGRALGLDGIEAALARVDIVVTQTGASEPVLRRAEIERVMKARHGRPLFLIDIAVPRDVEAECGQVYNVFLYDIDDLGRVVTGNRERRAEEAERGLEIVQQETARFTRWFEGLEAVPTIVALRERFEAVRAGETERILGRLEHLSERDRKLVEQYGEALVNKLLHGPSAQLRHLGSGDRGVQLASALRYLFRLDEGTAGEKGEAPRDEAGKDPAKPDA
jgi:glutamyl-tRNA reductase